MLLAWLTFYGSALASVKRAHIGCPEVVDADAVGGRAPRARHRRAGAGDRLLRAARLGRRLRSCRSCAADALVSLPWVPMSVVQSVIPISSVLIVVAEITHLIDLSCGREPRAGAGRPALADGLH